MEIGKVSVNKNSVAVIAEAGVNHNGQMKLAHDLIFAAARAGATVIKFQTYKAEKLTTKNAPKFWQWKDDHAANQFESYSSLDSFGVTEYKELKAVSDEAGIEFMSTPFDFDAVDMLVSIGVNGFKIASCDITNYPFLKYINQTKLPIFLSTGASDLVEIERALENLDNYNEENLCILHCTLCYPTEIENANLMALIDIQKAYPKFILGLSDHTRGTLASSTSVALGARVIEKHFTVNKNLLMSPDHAFANDENELKQLVEDCNSVLSSLGSGKKEVLECELPARNFARRSVVSETEIKMGETITQDHLSIKRPGTGIPPSEITNIIGMKARVDIAQDQLINLQDLMN